MRPTRSRRLSATTILERKYPSFGNLAPRDIASRAAKEVCDEGRGVGETGLGVYLDFADAIKRLGEDVIAERYGNLFEMYERITDENPYKVPMRIYPAVHYTMGGLWVDYNLMSTIPGLHVIGEANFSDHGANRLGASALMQGLADGYFIIPNTIGDYLASDKLAKIDATSRRRFARRRGRGRRADEEVSLDRRQANGRCRSTASSGRSCGTTAACRATKPGSSTALEKIPELREEFWRDVNVPGSGVELNQALEKAGRVADFLELGELMCIDALHRTESCGGHFREESQTPDGEALRDDEQLRLRRRVGIRRRRQAAGPQQGAARLREREAVAAELQVMNLDASRLAAGRPDAPGHRWSMYEATRHQRPTCRSSRCSTWSTSGLTERGEDADRVRPRLPRGHLRHRAA